MKELSYIFVFGALAILTEALPMQITINQRQSECMYDTLKEGETVTMSAIILAGTTLKATLTFDGPVAAATVDSGLELFSSSETFHSKGEGIVRYSQVIDFEHLAPAPEEEDDDDEVEDDDEGALDPNDPALAEKRKARRERQRKRFLEAKEKREKRKLEVQNKIREDGEPVLYTTKAHAAGWYRMCVHATWYQVLAEMELRKESELGALDEEGNVVSYEERRSNEEDAELALDSAAQEGIKEEDFEETRDRIKELRRMLNEIQSMQQKERRRLTVHAETNEHTRSRMVLSSLIETLLFMAISGYQIYTIRKWFSGVPVLGR